MAYQSGRTGRHRRPRNNETRLKYAFDAGFVSGAQDLDGGDSNSSLSSDSERKPRRSTQLTASLRVLSESIIRMEGAESEMTKAREALRLQAEKRRVEAEAELTTMLLRTQLQIATFVSKQSPNRKRKRAEEEAPPAPQREGFLVSSLLQCNLPF